MSVLNINRGNAPTNPQYIQLSAGIIQPSRTVTAATDTATLADYLILDNAAANAITQKLPAGLSSLQTMLLVIKKTDATANVVTIDANGSTIDGASTFLLYTQNSAVTLQWNGATWSIASFTSGLFLSYTPTIAAAGSMTVSGFTVANAQYTRVSLSLVEVILDVGFTLGGSASTDVTVSLGIAASGALQPLVASASLSTGTILMQLLTQGPNVLCRMNPFGNWPLGPVSGFRVNGIYQI
jgi:hypothetical protein